MKADCFEACVACLKSEDDAAWPATAERASEATARQASRREARILSFLIEAICG
jgi:hypothetical protein